MGSARCSTSDSGRPGPPIMPAACVRAPLNRPLQQMAAAIVLSRSPCLVARPPLLNFTGTWSFVVRVAFPFPERRLDDDRWQP